MFFFYHSSSNVVINFFLNKFQVYQILLLKNKTVKIKFKKVSLKNESKTFVVSTLKIASKLKVTKNLYMLITLFKNVKTELKCTS